MKANSVISLSPSFSTYSSCRLTDIAARVIEEPRIESGDDHDFYQESDLGQSFDFKSDREIENEDDDDDDDTEFSFVCREPPTSPIAADEIFSNGQIRPVYPLFDRSLLLAHDEESKSIEMKPRRMSLGKLMKEERDSASCSSSEADDLDGLSPETYCVWTPTKKNSSEKCRKSNSTGSSKRWTKFRDLLNRSNSEGKDNFVFFNPTTRPIKNEENEKTVSNGDGKVNRITKTYKQDSIGVFANVNGGVSKMVHPFCSLRHSH